MLHKDLPFYQSSKGNHAALSCVVLLLGLPRNIQLIYYPQNLSPIHLARLSGLLESGILVKIGEESVFFVFTYKVVGVILLSTPSFYANAGYSQSPLSGEEGRDPPPI